MRLISSIGTWLDERLQLASTIRETAEHAVPRKTASWFYVFGSAAFAVFILQIVTGTFARSTDGARISWSPSS